MAGSATHSGWVKAERDGDNLLLSAGGSWVIATLAELDARVRKIAAGSVRRARIDLGSVERMDTAGAWVLYRTRRDFRALGIDAEFEGVKPDHDIIFGRIAAGDDEDAFEEQPFHPIIAMVHRVGAATMGIIEEALDLLNFLGVIVVASVRVVLHPSRIRFVPLLVHIEHVGLNALPIVGLLSFLIGVVLAFQGADQLKQFGAEIFTVNLVGVSVLREMGILLTAIIVAGRSGSAFTAQIGTMQVNEEIDAMRAMGLDPIEVLVLPRVLALVIALPLLAMFANLMGLAGGAVMSVIALDISVVQFVERLKSVVPIWAFWVGMIKAPVFGLLIALVGCREGLKVGGSADSVGRQTTKSVVVSIFMVMVADAIFSIFFSFMKI
ncbi:MAG: MlaE family lipid ABC transporter permease subunit [Pseudomonadota bacterium]|nr:MlaE family lipid ABC transporter permease subunit [Pseudomonadota bacterium]